MELNKWYKLDANMEDEFIRLAPKINREIARYMANRPFQVIELEQSDNNGIYVIRFENEEPITRLKALPQFKETDWSSSWFYADEYEMFSEVKVTDKDDVEDRIVVVSSPGEVYTVGGATPTRFTLSKAKEHAEFVLKGNVPGTEVNIFRLETTARVVSEIKFD